MIPLCVLVPFLNQSSIQIKSVLASLNQATEGPGAAVVSACVIVASSGRTFATSTVVLHSIFSAASSSRRLDHIRRSHFMFYFCIFLPADSSIKTRYDSFNFYPSFMVNEFQLAPFPLASCVRRSASSFQSLSKC